MFSESVSYATAPFRVPGTRLSARSQWEAVLGQEVPSARQAAETHLASSLFWKAWLFNAFQYKPAIWNMTRPPNPRALERGTKSVVYIISMVQLFQQCCGRLPFCVIMHSGFVWKPYSKNRYPLRAQELQAQVLFWFFMSTVGGMRLGPCCFREHAKKLELLSTAE